MPYTPLKSEQEIYICWSDDGYWYPRNIPRTYNIPDTAPIHALKSLLEIYSRNVKRRSCNDCPRKLRRMTGNALMQRLFCFCLKEQFVSTCFGGLPYHLQKVELYRIMKDWGSWWSVPFTSSDPHQGGWIVYHYCSSRNHWKVICDAVCPSSSFFR